MSGNIIDSLFTSMGFDTTAVQNGIQSVVTYISSANVAVKEFASGFDKGLIQGILQVDSTIKKINTLQTEVKNLGQSLGSSLNSFFTDIATKKILSSEEPISSQQPASSERKNLFEQNKASNTAFELPEMSKGFEKIRTYIGEIEPFIVSFFSGMATAIEGTVVPSLATAEVALESFFVRLGTNKKASQDLVDTWEYTKSVGIDVWKGVTASSQDFFSYIATAIEPLSSLYTNELETIKALFTDNFQEAWEKVKAVWGNMGDYVSTIFISALNPVTDLWDSAGQACYGGFTSALSSLGDFIASFIPQWLKDLLGLDGGRGATAVIGEAVSGLGDVFTTILSPTEGTTDTLQKADNAVKNFGSGLSGSFGGVFGKSGEASASISPTLASSNTSTVDNSSRSTTSINKVVIETKSTDAKGISEDFSRSLVNANNFGVNQKGGR